MHYPFHLKIFSSSSYSYKDKIPRDSTYMWNFKKSKQTDSKTKQNQIQRNKEQDEVCQTGRR